MARSKADIANIALAKLGQSRISSLTEQNPRARAIAVVYDVALDSVLRMHRWNFAIRRTALVKLATAPAWGFQSAYQLPTDFVRMVQLENQSQDYRIEGDKLLTDAGNGNCLYIKREEEVDKYDPLFIRALTARLAAEVGKQLTGDAGVVNQMEAEYTKMLDEARYIDSLEKAPDAGHEPSRYMEARFNGEVYRGIEDAS
jgi:hypothetical protein